MVALTACVARIELNISPAHLALDNHDYSSALLCISAILTMKLKPEFLLFQLPFPPSSEDQEEASFCTLSCVIAHAVFFCSK